MYSNQFCVLAVRPQAGSEQRRVREKGDRLKTMHTPRELMALVSYLRQQEAKVLDTMQQLQDAS